MIPKLSHQSSLIFLHGLGDSAEGFVDLFLENSPVSEVHSKKRIQKSFY